VLRRILSREGLHKLLPMWEGPFTLLGKPLSVAHQFGLQWRTSGAPCISSHWYLLPVAHAHVRHGYVSYSWRT
jgi:hypothetical protein